MSDYIAFESERLMSKQLKNQLQSEFWQDLIDRCIHKHGYADIFLVKARGGGFKMTFFTPMEESKWNVNVVMKNPLKKNYAYIVGF